MEILGLDHIGIITGDLEESCRFYRDSLGFEDGERRAEPSLKLKFAYMHREGMTLEFLQPDEGSSAGQGLAHVALRCRDIHGVFSALSSQGASLLHKEVQEHGGLSFFFVKGPNGVLLEIVERRP
jgi:catechol 2,3-dioxygenase-like lactoylglutathione lyase family enzyme